MNLSIVQKLLIGHILSCRRLVRDTVCVFNGEVGALQFLAGILVIIGSADQNFRRRCLIHD